MHHSSLAYSFEQVLFILNIVKVALSLFILFHVITIFVFANQGSILHQTLPHFMINYATTLIFNSKWQFFAPNPMVDERYLKYEISLDDKVSAEKVVQNEDTTKIKYHYWPPKPNTKIFQENWNRMFIHSVLSTSSEDKVKNLFIPWACRKHSEAYSISIRKERRKLTTINVARVKDENFKRLLQPHDVELKEYICPQH